MLKFSKNKISSNQIKKIKTIFKDINSRDFDYKLEIKQIEDILEWIIKDMTKHE